jgi:hypothetical protein
MGWAGLIPQRVLFNGWKLFDAIWWSLIFTKRVEMVVPSESIESQ